MLPKLPLPGSVKGPPSDVSGVKYCRMGPPLAGCTSGPTPSGKEPDPLLGRQIDTSSSAPHSFVLGVHGNPLPHVVVPEICQPPITRSSTRREFPANI